MNWSSKRVVAIVSATAIMGCLAIGGVAYAQISNGTIEACAMKANGQLRLATAADCNSSEKAVSWNVQGPQGQQGVPGRRASPCRRAAGVPGRRPQRRAQGRRAPRAPTRRSPRTRRRAC